MTSRKHTEIEHVFLSKDDKNRMLRQCQIIRFCLAITYYHNYYPFATKRTVKRLDNFDYIFSAPIENAVLIHSCLKKGLLFTVQILYNRLG